MTHAAAPAKRRALDPTRPDARLAALWIGHATVLIQIDDHFFLTDPVLTRSVGMGFSPRLVQPGMAAENLPAIDAAVVSHVHFDHLSLGRVLKFLARAKHSQWQLLRRSCAEFFRSALRTGVPA